MQIIRGASAVLPLVGLDLSGLCREPVFTSHSRQESHRLLARELVEHNLSWRCGPVDTAFFRAEIGRCFMFVLRYGAEVEVRPRPFTDFVLVQMPLRGSASLECDGVHLELEAGQVAVLSPNHEARLLWRSGCEQLMVKVPRSLLAVTQERLIAEGGLPVGFSLPPAYRLDGQHGSRWQRLVGDLLEQLPVTDEPQCNPHWLRHLEESLPLFLLTHHPHADQAVLGVPRSAAERQALRQLDKVEAFMRSHMRRGVTLGELAIAGGISERSLNTLCQRRHGQTPMARLRNLRLEAARERLLSRRDLSVTEVALEFGFTNLGRFASYYRERFGELPGQTGRQNTLSLQTCT